MKIFRSQLEELESYLGALLSTSSSMTSGDIITALQAQYQPFLLLAARLQVVHEEIQRLKEQYINLKRLLGQDTTDVFVKQQLKKKSRFLIQLLLM